MIQEIDNINYKSLCHYNTMDETISDDIFDGNYVHKKLVSMRDIFRHNFIIGTIKTFWISFNKFGNAP